LSLAIQDSISISQHALLSKKASNILVSAGRRTVIHSEAIRKAPLRRYGEEERKEEHYIL